MMDGILWGGLRRSTNCWLLQDLLCVAAELRPPAPPPSETSWCFMFPQTRSVLWIMDDFFSFSSLFLLWWSLKLNVGWASFWGVCVSCEETFNIHMFIISDTESCFLSVSAGWSKTTCSKAPRPPPPRLLCSLYHEQQAAANADLIRLTGTSVGLSLIIVTEARQLPRWNPPNLRIPANPDPLSPTRPHFKLKQQLRGESQHRWGPSGLMLK